MDIPLNAEVHCTDGLVGHSSCIILNPVRQEITHFVLKRRAMLGYQELVPVSLIKESTPDMILLRVSAHELAKLEPFTDSEYINLNSNDEMPGDHGYGYEDVYGLPYREFDEPQGAYVNIERIPQDELGIHRGAHVDATDGRVGRVDEFVVEGEDCHITHLILHERHVFGDKVVTIPVSEIERIDNNVVHLNLTREQSVGCRTLRRAGHADLRSDRSLIGPRKQ